MNNSLFKKIHRNFIRSLNADKRMRRDDSHRRLDLHRKASPLGSTEHKRLSDPRFKTRKMTDEAASFTAGNRFGSVFPDWISLVEVNVGHTRVMKRYIGELRIDQEIVAELNEYSFGMLHKYFKVFRNEALSGDKGTFNLLTLIAPNIFTVANKIVRDKDLSPIYKSFHSVRDISKNDMFNHEMYWPDRDRKENRYSYIEEIQRRKPLPMQKKISSQKYIYNFDADSKYFDWDLVFKSPKDSATFKLTKAETVLFVVCELFELAIFPKLKFRTLRNRGCKLCGRIFNPYQETLWFGLIPPGICDICLLLAIDGEIFIHEVYNLPKLEIKNNCIAGVKRFESTFGFTPSSKIDRKRMLSDLLSIERLSASDIFTLSVVATLPRQQTAKSTFGSWSHMLEESGLLDGVRSPQGGYQSIARDGHLCLSIGERLICEFLTKSHIKHTKEPHYPRDKILNPRGLLRADFKVADTFIEFAGRMSNPDYALNIERKQKLARKYKINLMILETFDQDAIKELMRKFLSK